MNPLAPYRNSCLIFLVNEKQKVVKSFNASEPYILFLILDLSNCQWLRGMYLKLKKSF